jgi:hypothetical protein
MPQISLIAKYKKNGGIIISPFEVDAMYFYGSQFYSKDGTALSVEVKRTYIQAAQQEIEKYLNIKFVPELITETVSYYRDDYWQQFPIIKTNYPINTPLTLVGMVNKIEQIVYPQQWLFTSKSSEGVMTRRLNVVPNGSVGAMGNADVILTGISSNIGLQSWKNIPEYWQVQYVSGWNRKDLPMDLVNLVGKFASIGIFNIFGDLIIGAGIASQSISIDSLSQSISTTSSAENSGFSSRIIMYQKEIKTSLERLKNIYKGFSFTVL